MQMPRLAISRQELRCGLDRVRHPQCAAHRRGACGDAARAQARRPLPLLEFSNVDVPGLDALYELYSFNVVPALGRAIVGDAEPYRYLVESIRRFPRPNAFAEMMRAAGFARVSHRTMSGGIVALHSGWRL